MEIIPKAVKIATLLAQYLYTNKRLDVTGIGSFTLDPAAVIPVEGKQRPNILEGISFESNPQQKESSELIAYISLQTGKMKALASSDLDSHLLLVQQFLNIGKPFTFEGIGTIVKRKDGSYDFIAGAVAADKMKDLAQVNSSKEEADKRYDSAFLDKPAGSVSWRKPVIAFVILCGIGVAVWGGYMISRKKTATIAATVNDDSARQETNVSVRGHVQTLDTTTTAVTTAPTTIATPDTTSQQNKPVSTLVKTETTYPATTEGNYKYVLEVAQSKRAFKRYNQLLTNLWDVKLETSDSLQYKLYLLLPKLNADTTRVLDSLTVMTGRRVYIEHNN